MDYESPLHKKAFSEKRVKNKEKNLILSERKSSKKYSQKCLKNYEFDETDLGIEKILDKITSENNIKLEEIINFPVNDKYPFNGELFSHIIKKQNKTEKEISFLIYFLKYYDTFNDLLIKIYDIEEKIFLYTQILNKILIEEKKENDILFKIGEGAEKFYFLLQGTAIRLNTKKYEVIMNKFEYFIYMKYLYKLDENKLFNLILKENEEIFDKYELLYFIIGDKSIKYFGDSLKQLKNMEESYVSNRIKPNNMLEMNYNNENKIILTENTLTIDDILKGDDVSPLAEGHIKRINININNYLENLKPIEFDIINDELIKKKVVLYTYNIDKEINVGETLEELDLKKMLKRNYTIICNRNCTLGCFMKKEYISCLKVTQTKFHKNDINFLLSNELFSMLNFREFDNNYYHLFDLIKMNQKEMLFEQGEQANYIYFLKKGEICTTFEGSFNDIYKIIASKGGPKNRKMLDINYIKRFHSINIDEKIFTEKQKFTLFKIKENFPVGLDDYIDIENNNIVLFNAFCIMNSEVLRISRENFNLIINRENEVRKVKNNYINRRNHILIDELNILKNGLLQNYISEKYNLKLELPYLFDDSPLLLKGKIRQKNYLTRPKKIKNNKIKLETKLNDKLLNEIKKAIKTKINKDNIEIQKYKYLTDANKISKYSKDYINSKSNTISAIERNNSNTYRNCYNSLGIKNIKEFSKKGKLNNEFLDLIKSENSKKIIYSRRKNAKSLDPYEKIYNTLKIDYENRVTDFSYLNYLIPPHPNKQFSKSKKNIFNPSSNKIIFTDNSLSKLNIDETEKNHKQLISSISIMSSRRKKDKKEGLDFDETKLKNLLNMKDKLVKIFDRNNLKKELEEKFKKEIKKESPVIFPKINLK